MVFYRARSPQNSHIAAVVPAKGTSKRLPGKNLALINGEPLVTRKIRQLKDSECFEAIYVATDSEEIAEIAGTEGCKVLWRRPEWADDEKAKSLSETIAYLASQVQEPHLYWAQCTSPFVDSSLIKLSISHYFEALGEGYDSLISQQTVADFLWQNNFPFNYGLGTAMVRSQDLPQLRRMTFGILLAPTSDVVSWAYYHGPNPKTMLLDKLQSLDIDDEFEFQIAVYFARPNGLESRAPG
jgi:N-acylneuraminate cytidylyltransferase